MSTTNSYQITGADALRIAERDGVTLFRTEHGYTVEVVPVGWTGDATGYNVSDYFVGGTYRGADECGVEPKWADAWNLK